MLAVSFAIRNRLERRENVRCILRSNAARRGEMKTLNEDSSASGRRREKRRRTLDDGGSSTE